MGDWRLKTIDDHLAFVEVTGRFGCWRLPNKVRSDGYVYVTFNKKRVLAHRAVYMALIGPISEEKPMLDHLCRRRWCCHPNHVEPVTNRINSQRGNTGAHLRDRTHCPAGHPYKGNNVYTRPSRNGRSCRKCRQLQRRKRYLDLGD